MDIETIDDISQRLDDIQSEHALTDRAVAASIQLFVRTGDFPEDIADAAGLETALLDAAWLLFLAAPGQQARYLLVSSMHLGLVLSDDRPIETLFGELRTLATDDADTDDDPTDSTWLEEYRQLGADSLPEQGRSDEIRARFETARQILRDHHDEVLAFSRQIVDDMATDFDRDVRQGVLTPLGDDPAAEFDDPDEALKAAQQRQKDGDLEAAVHLYSLVLDERPDDVETLVERGVLRASLEDLNGAVDDFDRALTLDEDHLVARINRGLARHSLGEVEAAIDDYDRALSAVDDNPEIWVNRGIARFSNDDFEGALDDFNQALELDDEMATAYLQRGNVHRVLQKVGAALQDYEQAIELAPKFVDAYAARGYLHLQLEDVTRAIADFEKAIELQPLDSTLYYNRAHAHLLNDDVDAAIADYDQTLELDTEDVEALANRGAARMMNGDLDGALEDWETAIAINPYYPTPYLKRASMWIATEEFEEAAKDLQIALDNAPDDWPHRKKVEKTLESLLDDMGFDQPN